MCLDPFFKPVLVSGQRFFQHLQKCSSKGTATVSDGDAILLVESVAHQQMTVAQWTDTQCSMTLWHR